MGSRRAVLTTAASALFGRESGAIRRIIDPDEGDPDARIGFVGDVMLGRDVDAHYGSGAARPTDIWGDVRPRLESLDGVFCNLECCLSARGERFPDRGYYFRADPDWAVPALESGNVRWAALANNHTLDYGVPALLDTLDALDEGGIAHAGAGENPDTARSPSVVSVGGFDVGVVSFSDQAAVYAATDDRPGTAYVECDPANPETRRIVGDALERARERNPDLLVASLHWGPNWVEVPDETYREFGRWLVDEGVSIVHGHSAHVVQGVERYDDGVILHDTGDFVDDYTVDEDLRNDRSFLFEIAVDDGDLAEIRLVPVVIDDLAVRRADPREAAWLRKTIATRSEPFDATFEYDGDELIVEP